MRRFSLEEHLKKLNTDAILTVASLWRINVRASFADAVGGSLKRNDTRNTIKNQKRAILAEVMRQMCDKRRIKYILSSLSEREQQIIGIFALRNWSIERAELPLWEISEAELGIPPAQVTHSTHARKEQARGLLGLLLLVRVRKFGDAGSLVFVVPAEFREAITEYFSDAEASECERHPEEVASPEEEANPEEEENPKGEAKSERQKRGGQEKAQKILEDILVFLSHANSGGIPLTPSLRKIRKDAAERIKAELSEKSLKRLLLIRHICETLHLVEERFSAFSRRHNRHNLTSSHAACITHAPRTRTSQHRIVLATTKNAEEFLRKSREERILDVLRAFSRNYDDVKRCVLEELRKLRPNVWYKYSLFERRVKSAIFRKKSISEWLCFKKSAISKVLTHLLLLGLADSAYAGTESYFRLKPAFFKDAEEAEKAETAGERTLIVQPNFEVVAFPETSHEVLFRLSKFSVLLRAEITKVFKITREKVLCAIESGMQADEILRFLREHARNEVPQNVIFTLKSWCDSFGKAVIKRCILLKTSPEFLELLGRTLEVVKIAEDCALIGKEEFFNAFKMQEVLVLEAKDDVTAVEIEKATGINAINNNKIFLLNGEEADVCVNALKKHGIFPKVI
ncbi:MAG: helicase-associated domain-containing protein [Candidatus Methanospirare jalkutatii]|nr:helicase-associated domain-containing protein [Candidatus Methanospirare jalkutatii]